MPNNQQKKSRVHLTVTPDISSIYSLKTEITFRDALKKRSTSYDLLHGEKPIHGDHSLMPYAHGNHACSRDGDCVAEMFFSLLFIFFVVIIPRIGLQKYTLFSKYASFSYKFLIYHFYFLIFFVPLHPQNERYTLLK